MSVRRNALSRRLSTDDAQTSRSVNVYKQTTPKKKKQNADDIEILPLPTKYHRNKDEQLKRLEMMQAQTGKKIVIQKYNSSQRGGKCIKRKPRRDVIRGWRNKKTTI